MLVTPQSPQNHYNWCEELSIKEYFASCFDFLYSYTPLMLRVFYSDGRHHSGEATLLLPLVTSLSPDFFSLAEVFTLIHKENSHRLQTTLPHAVLDRSNTQHVHCCKLDSSRSLHLPLCSLHSISHKKKNKPFAKFHTSSINPDVSQ